jgi:peptidoglycan/xylan/chitin deacetylase (PgdA/CDA1 family)
MGALREMWEVPRDLLRGGYPPFVTGGPLPRGDVPVFVFHSLEPIHFGAQLTHLAENGYRTLGADEYLAVLEGREAAPDRAVVLTFDDGRGSLWTVGAPLLRRHGMKGIVFLVPGRTPSRPGPRFPTWDDVEPGRATAHAVLAREQGEGSLLSWEEVEDLARSGVFDFESHTQMHARIHVGARVTAFLTPDGREGYAAFDVPLLAAGAEPGRDLLPHEAALGTPLLESAPRTSEALRFYEDPAVRERCVAAVAAGGGVAFFAKRDWARRLRQLLPSRVSGRIETPEERERALRAELADARAAIEAHTGRPVRLLCYPWHAWGPLSRRLSAETGYAAALGGKVEGTPITRAGGDLLAIARVGDDYVETLPGRGRAGLATVLARKWRRRLGRAGRGA